MIDRFDFDFFKCLTSQRKNHIALHRSDWLLRLFIYFCVLLNLLCTLCTVDNLVAIILQVTSSQNATNCAGPQPIFTVCTAARQ